MIYAEIRITDDTRFLNVCQNLRGLSALRALRPEKNSTYKAVLTYLWVSRAITR